MTRLDLMVVDSIAMPSMPMAASDSHALLSMHSCATVTIGLTTYSNTHSCSLIPFAWQSQYLALPLIKVAALITSKSSWCFRLVVVEIFLFICII